MSRIAHLSLLVTLPASTLACLPEEGLDVPPLGLFEAAEVSVILDDNDGLNGPRDLDFNPAVPGELWVQNRTDDVTITVRNLGKNNQEVLRRKDPYALHFMEETSSLSFSPDMKFGSCGESRNTYDDQVEGNDFMGPALWSADDAIFAISNPEAIADNQGFDLGSHLDMMHETPLCMGIAWVEDNVYFVFEGLTGTIARYDFKTDHGPGFDFHGDGTVERFVDVAVTSVADVPSHLAYDHDNEILYVADTGTARVLAVDVSDAIQMRQFRGFETMVQESEGATVTNVLKEDNEGADLQLPSGLALENGLIFVADNLTSTVTATTPEGEIVDSITLDIAEGGLMGIRVHDDALYAVDFEDNRVLKVSGLSFPE